VLQINWAPVYRKGLSYLPLMTEEDRSQYALCFATREGFETRFGRYITLTVRHDRANDDDGKRKFYLPVVS
jgi:hypothetical protein